MHDRKHFGERRFRSKHGGPIEPLTDTCRWNDLLYIPEIRRAIGYLNGVKSFPLKGFIYSFQLFENI